MRKDTFVPWCWTLQRRCMPSDSALFRDGDLFCHMGWKQLPVEDDHLELDTREAKIMCNITGCSAVFSSLKKFEAHYNITHQHVCSICHKILPSAHLLEIHVLETHDSMFHLLAASKNMYQCLLESCTEKFHSECSRRQHMIKVHKYPANFRFDRKKSDRNKSQTTSKSGFQTSQKQKAKLYHTEVSSLMDVCTVVEASGDNMETVIEADGNSDMETVMEASGNKEMETNVDMNIAEVSRCLSTENDSDVDQRKGIYTSSNKFNTDTSKKEGKESSKQLLADKDQMTIGLTILNQCRTEQRVYKWNNNESGIPMLPGSVSGNNRETGLQMLPDMVSGNNRETGLQMLPDSVSGNNRETGLQMLPDSVSGNNRETGLQMLTGSNSVNMNGIPVEDYSTENVSNNAPSRKFTYKVPQNICFGHGSTKSFQRSKKSFPKKTKEKHWHNAAGDNSNTKADIENVDLSDLSSALMDQ